MATERSSRAQQAGQGFVDGLGHGLAGIERSAEDDLEGIGLGDRLMDAATEPSVPKDPQEFAAEAQLAAFRASCQERGTAVREETEAEAEDEARMPRHRHRAPAKGPRR